MSGYSNDDLQKKKEINSMIEFYPGFEGMIRNSFSPEAAEEILQAFQEDPFRDDLIRGFQIPHGYFWWKDKDGRDLLYRGQGPGVGKVKIPLGYSASAGEEIRKKDEQIPNVKIGYYNPGKLMSKFSEFKKKKNA